MEAEALLCCGFGGGLRDRVKEFPVIANEFAHRLSHGLPESWQIGLFWRSQEASPAIGCPIDFQQTAPVELFPKCRAQEREESGETVIPPTDEGREAHEDVGQERRPDLPENRLGISPQEIRQLEGLLQFLIEGFDRPLTLVEVGDAPSAPGEVVA